MFYECLHYVGLLQIDEEQEGQDGERDDDQAACENERNANRLPSAAAMSHLSLLDQIKMVSGGYPPVSMSIF